MTPTRQKTKAKREYMKVSVLLLCTLSASTAQPLQPKKHGGATAIESKGDRKKFDTLRNLNLGKDSVLKLEKGKAVSVISHSGTTVNFKVQEEATNDWFNLISALVGVIFGFALTKASDWRSRLVKRTKTGRRWISEIERLRSTIGRQIEANLGIINSYRDDHYIAPSPKLVSGIDCINFQSLEKGDLFQYTEWITNGDYNRAVEISNSINEWVDRVKDSSTHITTSVDQFKSNSSAAFANFNELFQELVPSIGELLIDGSIRDHVPPPTAVIIQQLTNTHIRPYLEEENGNFDVFVLKNQFLRPLIRAVIDYTAAQPIADLVDQSRKCINVILRMKAEYEYLNTNLETINRLFEDLLQELDDTVSQLKK